MSITPTRAANQLFTVWCAARSEAERFPVDCRAIANELGIKVHGQAMDGEFQGALFIEDGLKAIIYNESIREKGRKNFTIGHELGHFSLHKNRTDLRCSMEDLNDFAMGPHPANIEQEANAFAARLLMPSSDFSTQIRGRQLTLGLLGDLGNDRYETTLTATTRRLVELTSQPVALIMTRDDRVQWPLLSERMKQTGLVARKGAPVSKEALAGCRDGRFVDSRAWLDEVHAERWNIFQSVVNMTSYNQTLVLLHAFSREGEADLWDDVKDTVDLIPHW